MFWPCFFLNARMSFTFSIPALALFVSLALFHHCLPASWQILFNWPSLARNAQQDAIQPAKRGARQVEY